MEQALKQRQLHLWSIITNQYNLPEDVQQKGSTWILRGIFHEKATSSLLKHKLALVKTNQAQSDC